MSKIIMGIQLKNRVEDSPDFQSLLSKYGSIIQTRIGLHSASGDTNRKSGVILLDFIDDPGAELDKFNHELEMFENIEVKKMVF